jgi:hypothetical protein
MLHDVTSPDDRTPAPPSAEPLYVPLPKPPSAQSITVRKLIGRVHEGAIRVPPFQRPLRWRASDVVKLFDSILKGYPVGSLLFWKRAFGADEHLLLGSATLRVPANPDGWYIVDGQQRVTALAASLLDVDQGADPRWNIRYDPATDTFLSGPASPADLRVHVPLRTLGDLRRLGRWFRSAECGLPDELQTRVEEVQQRLLDYELPAYVVETDKVEALQGVFARLNSTGVRMRQDEVFRALLGHTDGVRSARSVDLAELQRAANVDDFGEPPRTEVLKALLAMSGLDPSKRLEDVGENAVGKLVPEDEAVEAIRRTSAFLSAPVDAAEPGAGIPAYAFIPYPVVFVILARWFHLFPEPDATTRRALSLWLWRGVETGVHQRAAVSAMRHQVREIRDDDMAGSIERLVAAVGEPTDKEWVLDPFHASHAASRVEILAMLERRPRDLTGEISWRALLSDGERVAREIFRVDVMDAASRERARTAANRVLLDARHTDLRLELVRWSWPEHRAALESHLVDEVALAELRRKDDARFLERRGSRLRSLVSSFLARRAGLGGPRLLPVEAYYERGAAPESGE